MKRGLPFFVLVALLFSCNKEEKNDLVWDRSSGRGVAYFINAAADSGFLTGGQVDGNPYLVKYNSSKEKVMEIRASGEGLFSDAWSDTICCITAGSRNGKLLLSRFDMQGNQVWEKSLDTTCRIEFARLKYTGNGHFLVMGTPGPDSPGGDDPGLLFLGFDTAGKIGMRKIIPGSGFISAGKADFDFDNSGDFYLGLTRRQSASGTRASVAKFSSDFNKLWETELFNNPGFSSASLSVRYNNGNVFVTGRTEIPGSTGTMMNSFVISLDESGRLSNRWTEKKYPEFFNEGSAIEFDLSGNLIILNRNCMILNIIDPDNGTDLGIIRPFKVCVSETTDAFGYDLDIDYDGNILLAGSLGGNFYTAIKAALE